MSAQDSSPDVRQQRKAELALTLFRHGFDIVGNEAAGDTLYVRVATTHTNPAAEPLMLDYKRDLSNYIRYGLGTAHDVAMHFVHRYAFRTQAWVHPLES